MIEYIVKKDMKQQREGKAGKLGKPFHNLILFQRITNIIDIPPCEAGANAAAEAMIDAKITDFMVDYYEKKIYTVYFPELFLSEGQWRRGDVLISR